MLSIEAPSGKAFAENHILPERVLCSSETPSINYLDIDEVTPTERLPKFLQSLCSRLLASNRFPTLKRAFRAFEKWSRGPPRPQIQKITTVVALLEHVSSRLQDELAKKKLHSVSLAVWLLLWAFLISSLLWQSSSPLVVEGYGTAKPISCMKQAWSLTDSCGLNGIDCGPFDNVTTAYQCYPDCASKKVFEPHVVGDQEVIYKSLVIGGARDDNSVPVYRADSSICQAAIHAGALKNANGGIVISRLVGQHAEFPATLSNGIQSVSFDAKFPKSFVFESVEDGLPHPADLRWVLLMMSLLTTSMVSVFISSPTWFFTSTFTIIFVHVALVSDRPELSTLSALISVLAGRFLPAVFTVTVIFMHCVRPQLGDLHAPLERTVLWLGSAWFGALENYTLDRLPIRRLTPHDLKSQSGSILTLIIIIAIILAIAIGQIHYFRLEGRLRRYIKLYLCMAGGFTLLATIPSLHLRIHHYILALLLLPGTAIQTRPSLVYQGLLIGLFINGVARWGFASILQTDDDIRGDDGRYGSPLPKVTASPAIKTIDFRWELPPLPYEGVSVLVNDVERYRWYVGQEGMNYTWDRSLDPAGRTYFRFAYRIDEHAVDYTKAGVWEADGRWTSF